MGYIKLSKFMATKNYPVFRQFQEAAARDLLYLQAELVHLESEYQRVAKADRESGDDDERHLYAFEWWHLSQSEARGFEGEQWALALQIRTKLREYYTSLHQYNEISLMKRPKDSQVKSLREWIESPHLGGGCGFLGRDLGGFAQEAAYDPKHVGDLVMLSEELGEDDMLTSFISGPLLRLFHTFWQRYKVRPENRSSLYYYSDEHVNGVINIIGTVASSLTPMISIIVLYVIQSTRIRLGLVCVFTLLFSLVLALATKARRIEIFAATAAFASVQVVFVGSVGNSSGG
ncbi:uncharacterized protein K444DRAFT_689534 [Hyaloscypha bicolor E]|uniref:DUF6594 domain-containing protein n=1 Tax=Hyaloscypha bicolor E TaxID=1095630 RepID=A0A2J6TVN7_9HELO|nr:uncharacterized protein K444DRAFT_689534 [Hyaloscypha bicolor E]PMD67067.1 hypothetical protein K444DRAFT_689534 [Hyaloscypha bicolor E]